MSLILFLMYANNIYATTTGTYTVSENSSGIGKIVLLFIGVLLVSLVLFAGYIMDKNENTKKERERFIKKHKEKEDLENDNEIKTAEDKYEDYDSEENDDYEDDGEDEDYEDDSEDENYYTQKINLTSEYDKEEEDSIESLNELERNLIEKYIDEDDLEENRIANEEIEDNQLDNNNLKNNEEKYTEEDNDTEDFEDDDDDEILIKDNSFNEVADNLMNSTMIFNTSDLKEERNENTVKGYDYEEDDLSEIESMIKAANIKRYTRKKAKGEERLKPRKKVIVFKKAKNDNDIIAKTRKKMAELKETQKPKRGRPPKGNTEEILGWTEIVELDEQRGAMEYTAKKRFCDLLKTHTCRRSLATNMYKAGASLSSIMAITGHSSEQQLKTYLKLDESEKSMLAAKENYFTKLRIVK